MVRLSGGISNIKLKNQWGYKISITFKDEKGKLKTIDIEYPFNLQFRIIKNTSATTNTATFTITNLSETTREYIRQDRLYFKEKKYISFEIGYQDKRTRVFRGYIQEAYSVKSGVDILTKIEAWDIGQDQFVAKTFEAGTTYKEALKQLVAEENMQKSQSEIVADYGLSALDKLKIANTGNLNGEFKTPTTIMGKPINAINILTAGHAYVDDGEINTLMDNECLEVPIPVLSAKTGLIGTPQRREAQLVLESLLMPSLKVGQLLQINSETADKYNGTYFVCGFEHIGEFGGTKAGSRKTIVNLWFGDAVNNNSNVNLTNTTEKEPFMQVKGEERREVFGNYGSDIDEVYRYLVEHKGNMKAYTKKITENISWREMIQPTGSKNTDYQVLTQVTKADLQNMKNIAQELQKFINTWYGNLYVRLQIVSGWRSKENNASLKNASLESVHLRGGAIDFRFKGLNTLDQFNRIFKPYYPKFCYWYPADSGNYYIHVQNTFGVGGAKRKRGQ